MRRRFRGQKHKNHSFLFFVFLLISAIFINYKILDNVSYAYLVNDSTNKNKFFKYQLDKEKLLLSLGLNYKIKNEKRENDENKPPDIPVFNEEDIKPKIYLYNTHQTEEYVDGNISQANEYLKKSLEARGVDVILDKTDIAATIKKQNLAYKDSYKITRNLLESTINSEISIYIDLHRDSSKKEITTSIDNDVSYAKIMFVIGGKHDTYKDNYNLCDDLNKILKSNNKTLTRGIYVRKSSSFNQDLASNIILIELGGPENTMEEVKNTVNVLADTLANYFKE